MNLSNKNIIRIKTYDDTYAINTTLPEIGNVLSISSLSVDIGYDAKYECIEDVYFQNFKDGIIPRILLKKCRHLLNGQETGFSSQQ